MTDRQLIELGAQELAARHGFSDGNRMRQRDFEYLCTRIEESSGILISLSTIKRIMNGQYNRLPQVATLNAISVYLGYADWQAFRAAKHQPAPTPATQATPNLPAATTANHNSSANPDSANPNSSTSTTQSTPNLPAASTANPNSSTSTSPTPHRPRLSYPLIGAGALLLLLIALLSWNYFSSAPAKDTRAATFAVRKTTQNAIPNTVVFTYDIDHLAGDSFFIQQSWDKNRRVRISRNNHTLTDIYYEPGYHTAKLIADDRIVKTIPVSIPTDNWFFYSKESLTTGLPNYIHPANPIHNGILGLDKQDLIDNHIDPQKPQIYLCSWFPSNIGVDADNFRLRARVRMKDIRNTACPMVMPEVFCQHGFMYFVYHARLHRRHQRPVRRTHPCRQ